MVCTTMDSSPHFCHYWYHVSFFFCLRIAQRKIPGKAPTLRVLLIRGYPTLSPIRIHKQLQMKAHSTVIPVTKILANGGRLQSRYKSVSSTGNGLIDEKYPDVYNKANTSPSRTNIFISELDWPVQVRTCYINRLLQK